MQAVKRGNQGDKNRGFLWNGKKFFPDGTGRKRLCGCKKGRRRGCGGGRKSGRMQAGYCSTQSRREVS